MWASLHLSGDSPRGSRQSEDLSRLLTRSGEHLGKSHYSLTPSNQYGQASIFQKTLRGLAVRMKTRVGC